MEGASVGGVDLVIVLDGVRRGLDVPVFFRDIWQGGASTSLHRVSQGESSKKLLECGSFSEGPFSPWRVRNSWPEHQSL